MFKVNNTNIRTALLTSFCCFYCETRTYFAPSSTVSVIKFEQVNVSWKAEFRDFEGSEVNMYFI